MKKSLLKERIHASIEKIEDKDFLKALYVLVQALVEVESVRRREGKSEKQARKASLK